MIRRVVAKCQQASGHLLIHAATVLWLIGWRKLVAKDPNKLAPEFPGQIDIPLADANLFLPLGWVGGIETDRGG